MDHDLTNLLGALEDVLIPLAALMIPITVLSIPIVAIVTVHRRKMAELRFAHRPIQNSDEVAALRREVAELKEMVHTQMLALDTYAKGPVPNSTDAEMQDRITTGR